MEAVSNLFESVPSACKKDFQSLKLIDKGSYGSVFLVRKKGDYVDEFEFFAMKEIKKDADPIMEELSNSEVEILAAIRNQQFLVNLRYSFESKKSKYLIMDYIPGGNLSNLLDLQTFQLEEARFYVSEIVLALEHLHNLGIVHRDIKLDNIMIDHEGHIVLVDYGCAFQFLKDNPVRNVYSNYLTGTPAYVSPEVLNYEVHGMPVDWWALGILTHFLLAQTGPFSASSLEECEQRIKTDIPTIDESLTFETADFIRRLLNKDPERRLGSNGGANELKEHDIFTEIDWNIVACRGYAPPFIPNVQLPELDNTSILSKLISKTLELVLGLLEITKIYDLLNYICRHTN